MTERNYDAIIADHYRAVAQQDGLAPTSTMADTVTRQKETQVIIEYVGHFLSRKKRKEPAVIMDVGCGNGYTLEMLSQRYPTQVYIGIEKSDELRALAESRFENLENITIFAGDLRDSDFSKGHLADVLICQRVLINLLDESDQRKALENLVSAVRAPKGGEAGGMLLFVEAFSSALERLNIARDEFELPAMEPSHHNLYLTDDFFNFPALKPYPAIAELAPSNFLSTHYFVTRVLHPIMLQEKPFKRNSEFVAFFSQALKQNVGDYSPLKLFVFERA